MRKLDRKIESNRKRIGEEKGKNKVTCDRGGSGGVRIENLVMFGHTISEPHSPPPLQTSTTQHNNIASANIIIWIWLSASGSALSL